MFSKTFFSTLTLLFTAGSLFIQANTALAQEKQKSTTQIQFEELANQDDQDGIIKLWQENPGETAFVIDSYLEGDLAVFEQSGHEAQDKIKAMYDTELRGALAAD